MDVAMIDCILKHIFGVKMIENGGIWSEKERKWKRFLERDWKRIAET